jgi:uncharacterized membrane protein
MPHCTKCGAAVADGAGFCPNCGAAQVAVSGVAPSNAMTQTGMKENVAGLLCYVLGWVTGLIFFFIDKRSFVQFHAKQSIVIFGGLSILRIIVGLFIGASFVGGGLGGGFSLAVALLDLLYLASVVLWIICMIKAYQGERFRVPIAADLAEQIFGKS